MHQTTSQFLKVLILHVFLEVLRYGFYEVPRNSTLLDITSTTYFSPSSPIFLTPAALDLVFIKLFSQLFTAVRLTQGLEVDESRCSLFSLQWRQRIITDLNIGLCCSPNSNIGQERGIPSPRVFSKSFFAVLIIYLRSWI